MAETQVNSVSVTSIDEERLKFRVILGVDAVAKVSSRPGQYNFDLPPLTSFGNSNHYNQCVMSCDGVSFKVQNNINDAVWTDGANFTKMDSIELKASCPSSQTGAIKRIGVNDYDEVYYGQFRQMIPLKCNLIGNIDGTIAAIGAIAVPLGAANNTGLFGTGCYAWQGVGLGEPVLSGNPFGDTLTLTLTDPSFPFSSTRLVSAATGVGGIDQGTYAFQFTITMVPNK